MDLYAEENYMKCISLKRTSIGAFLNDALLISQRNSQLLNIREIGTIRQSAGSSTSHAIGDHEPPSITNEAALLEHISTWLDNQNILVRLERGINTLMDEYQWIADFEIYPLEYEMRTKLLIEADIRLKIILLVNAEETHRVNDTLEEHEEWIELIEAIAIKSFLLGRGRELMENFLSNAKLAKEEMFNEELDTMTAIKFAEEGDREDLLQYLRNRSTVASSRTNTSYFSPQSSLQPRQPYPQGNNPVAQRPSHNGPAPPPLYPAAMGGAYQGPGTIYPSRTSVPPPQNIYSWLGMIERHCRRGGI
eukprot:Tbor_TRINITY_DN2888_c0_g1::TRINITY_DN2888_c0_g1_i1::g.23245::m.23245